MLHLLLALMLPNANLIAGDSRCNDFQASQIQAQLQQFANRPAAKGQQEERLSAILAEQSDTMQERTILYAVCSADDFAPLNAQLYALDAWADLLARENGPSPVAACPDKQKVVDAGLVADAYLKLAQAATLAPKPAALVAKLLPQVQSLAAQSGVTLPAYSATTAYWASQYRDTAKQAIESCLSPSATPSPTP